MRVGSGRGEEGEGEKECSATIESVIRIILGVILVGVIWETIRMKKRPCSAISMDCRRFCSVFFA